MDIHFDNTLLLEKNREDCSTAIESRAVQRQTLALLDSIGLDSGVQELVPFLVQFAEYQIYHSFSQEGATTKTPRYCRLLVQLIERIWADYIERQSTKPLSEIVAAAFAAK